MIEIIEPSDWERAGLPAATQAYIEALEIQIDAMLVQHEAFVNELRELRDKLNCLESQRASEADVLNTELRENYGDRFQVEVETDWRDAIRALVNGARRVNYYR